MAGLEGGKYLYFLFGTQMGNAESVARMLHQESTSKGYPKAQVMSLDDSARKKIFDQADPSPSSNKGTGPRTITLVIVCSTYGDGDFPDSALVFKRWLKKPSFEGMQHIRYCVLAIGDTNYSTFCGAGKHIDHRLEALGAVRFYPRGEADDAIGLEVVVEPWSEKLWPALANVDAKANAPILQVEKVVPDLNTPQEVLLVYSGGLPRRLALTLHELILRFGGRCALQPLTYFAAKNLSKEPRLVIILYDSRQSKTYSDLPFIQTLHHLARNNRGTSKADNNSNDNANNTSKPNNTNNDNGLDSILCGWFDHSNLTGQQDVAKRYAVLDMRWDYDKTTEKAENEVAHLLKSIASTLVTGALAPLIPKTTGVDDIATNAEEIEAWVLKLLEAMPGVVAPPKDVTVALRATLGDWMASPHLSSTVASREADNRLKASAVSGSATTDGSGAVQRKDSFGSSSQLGGALRSATVPLVFLYTEDDATAAEIATDLKTQASSNGFSATDLLAINNFRVCAFPRSATFVFIIGRGSPKSTQRLFRYLKNMENSNKNADQKQQQQAMTHLTDAVRFAILGIDESSSSEIFNGCALTLESSLTRLGACKVHCTGLADISNKEGCQPVVADWSHRLWGAIRSPSKVRGYIDSGSTGGIGMQLCPGMLVGVTGAAAEGATALSGTKASAAANNQFISISTTEKKDGTLAQPHMQIQVASGLMSSASALSWFPWESVPFVPSVAAETELLLLYSSKGMARTLAEHLATEAHSVGFQQVGMEAFGKISLGIIAKARNVVLLCEVSDAGQYCTLVGGRRLLHRLEDSSLDPDTLSEVRFAILSIGSFQPLPVDTSNTNNNHNHSTITDSRNHPANRLSHLMSRLLANRVFPVAMMPSLSLTATYALPWFRGVYGVFTSLAQSDKLLAETASSSSNAMGTLSPSPSRAASPAAAAVRRRILFLFGSVTGNAEAIARDLHREALQRGFHSRVAALRHFERMNFLTSDNVVIVISTANTRTGFPDNARRFAKYIYKELPTGHLNGLNYAVLALGHSMYGDKFCKAGKEVDERLAALGGVRVNDIGLADDQARLEQTVESWRKKLFKKLTANEDVTITANKRSGSTSKSASRTPTPLLKSIAVTAEAPPVDDNKSAVSAHSYTAAAPPTPLKLLVMYGSQSGNAESIANNVHERLEGDGYVASVGPLSQMDKLSWRTYKYVIIVTSTHGEGDFPDNAIFFWRFIRQKSHPSDLLNGLKYTVLALGDTNYSRFCNAGRNIDRRMEELGATRFYARGEADDAMGLESVVEPWIDGLMTLLKTLATPKPIAAPTTTATTGNKTGGSRAADTESVATEHSSQSTVAMRRLMSDTDGTVINATIHSWRALTTAKASNEVIHLTLCVPETLQWSPGGAISILPPNPDAQVDKLLTLLGVKGSDLFLPPNGNTTDTASLYPSSPLYERLTYPVTNRDVLLHYVSLRIYNKQILNVLSNNTKDSAELAILKSWMNSQNNNEWKKYLDEKVTVISLLERFKQSRPPFRHVVEHLMILQPRFYSISSAKCVDPTHLSITFKVVEGGLCTNWLRQQCRRYAEAAASTAAAVVCGDGSSTTTVNNSGIESIVIPFQLRHTNEFRLPMDRQIPMILIGPGTGVAPFLSFLQHREYQAKMLTSKEDLSNANNADEQHKTLRRVGETHLFFGCRMSDADYLFKEELERFERKQLLAGLHVAFSQEPSGGLWYGGCYVQDKMQGVATRLCNLVMNHGAYIYVCGDAESMAKDVHRVLGDILEEYNRWTPQEASAYLEKVLEEGRYQRDIWS